MSLIVWVPVVSQQGAIKVLAASNPCLPPNFDDVHVSRLSRNGLPTVQIMRICKCTVFFVLHVTTEKQHVRHNDDNPLEREALKINDDVDDVSVEEPGASMKLWMASNAHPLEKLVNNAKPKQRQKSGVQPQAASC